MRANVDARLPRTRDRAAIARRLIEEHVGPRAGGESLDDLKLVVTELVDNAYLHGRGEIHFRLRSRGDRVRVEVIDEGHGAAVRITERGLDEVGGFGLKLVDQVSTAWGAYEGTTHVWAELSLE
jgi:anti-sigma regulatory factor (Ser/Thr protein kinase)